MGKKGKEIVELDVKALINELNKAVAEEWLAAYQYWAAAEVAKGIHAPEIVERFRKAVQDEIGHASALAKRIGELGGIPVTSPAQLEKVAGHEAAEPPKDPTDIKRIISDALKTEAGAIELYNRLVKKTAQKDPVTFQLVARLLADEVAEEEEYENLLAKLD